MYIKYVYQVCPTLINTLMLLSLLVIVNYRCICGNLYALCVTESEMNQKTPLSPHTSLLRTVVRNDGCWRKVVS